MSLEPVEFDPARPVITTDDARLTRLLLGAAEKYASISEYAAATGIPTGTILQLLGSALDTYSVTVEPVGDELFLHTAPHGRPVPLGCVQVPANLWERLRANANEQVAYSLWRLVRAMERSGWVVETKPSRIMFGLAQLADRPYLGVQVANTVVPLILLPTAESLASPVGLLAEYERAGAPMVGVVCESGALDEMVTAVRRWVLSRNTHPVLSVLLLESPNYEPTFIGADDAAVAPRSITRMALESMSAARALGN